MRFLHYVNCLTHLLFPIFMSRDFFYVVLHSHSFFLLYFLLSQIDHCCHAFIYCKVLWHERFLLISYYLAAAKVSHTLFFFFFSFFLRYISSLIHHYVRVEALLFFEDNRVWKCLEPIVKNKSTFWNKNFDVWISTIEKEFKTFLTHTKKILFFSIEYWNIVFLLLTSSWHTSDTTKKIESF